MKSSRHLYTRLLASGDRMAAIRALGNGRLRRLIRHIGRQGHHTSDGGELIYGMCMVCATERFVAGGKRDGKLF